MTINEILGEITPIKSITKQTLYTRLRRLKISPLGDRQNPQQYPQDTAKRILASWGLADSPAPASRLPGPPNGTAIGAPAKPRQVKLAGKVLQQTQEAKPTLKLGRVVSLRKLQQVRDQTRKAVRK